MNGREDLSWLSGSIHRPTSFPVSEIEITGIVGTISIQKEFVDPWPMPPGAEPLLVTRARSLDVQAFEKPNPMGNRVDLT